MNNINGFTDFRTDTIVGDEEALNRHRLALFVLTQKDRPIPSLAEMLQEVDRPENLATVKERIAEMQTLHSEDLERMYQFHAEEYWDEMQNRCLSRDESQSLSKGEKNPLLLASYAKLDTFYADTRRPTNYTALWNDDFSRIRHAHLTALVPLEARCHGLASLEEIERKRRDAQFPISIAEFYTKPKDVQLRVGKFLTSSSAIQEKMMSDFGWVWRQIKPLKDEYLRTETFKAEIQAMLVELAVRDPRSKGLM